MNTVLLWVNGVQEYSWKTLWCRVLSCPFRKQRAFIANIYISSYLPEISFLYISSRSVCESFPWPEVIVPSAVIFQFSLSWWHVGMLFILCLQLPRRRWTVCRDGVSSWRLTNRRGHGNMYGWSTDCCCLQGGEYWIWWVKECKRALLTEVLWCTYITSNCNSCCWMHSVWKKEWY